MQTPKAKIFGIHVCTETEHDVIMFKFRGGQLSMIPTAISGGAVHCAIEFTLKHRHCVSLYSAPVAQVYTNYGIPAHISAQTVSLIERSICLGLTTDCKR